MKSRRFKASIVYYTIIVIVFIGYLFYALRNMADSQNNLLLTKENPLSLEYLSLFNLRDTFDMKPLINYITKHRSPISLFDYKKKYTLIIYKICDNFEIPITNVLQIKNTSSDSKTNNIYTSVNENHFQLYFSDDTTNKFNFININLSGDSIINLIQSNYTIAYYLKFGQISWSKLPNNNLDVYIEPKDISPFAKKIPASIGFIRHTNSLYFVLLSVNDYSKSFDTKLLQNLLTIPN